VTSLTSLVWMWVQPRYARSSLVLLLTERWRYITSRNSTGRVHVPTGEVTAEDIEKAIQSARDGVPLPADRQIIHGIVRDFALDGQRGVKRPLGMSGNVLEVELHIVTGMASIIDNLERCVTDAGIVVQQRVLEPLATSLAVVTEAERDLGVVLVDIGGGTSDVAVFDDGEICHTSAIPLGGEVVTKDLAQLLRTSLESAEEIKRRFGFAMSEMVAGDEMIQVEEVGTGELQQVPRRLVARRGAVRRRQPTRRYGSPRLDHTGWSPRPCRYSAGAVRPC